MPRSANRLRYSLTSGLHGAARAGAFGRYSALANESDGSYRVGKVNVDEQPELAKRFGYCKHSDGNPVQERRGGSETDGSCTQSAFLNMLQEAK